MTIETRQKILDFADRHKEKAFTIWVVIMIWVTTANIVLWIWWHNSI